jgi:hypothetical protein
MRIRKRESIDQVRLKIIDLLWERHESPDGIRHGVLGQARLAHILDEPRSRVAQAMNGPRLQRLAKHSSVG